MSIFLRKPLLAAIIAFVVILGVCLIVSVPLFNALCVYDKALVHITAEQKVSLQNLLGWNINDLAMNQISPKSITLTKQGWVILFLFHLGLPTLIYLRFYFAKKKAELNDAE